MRIILVFLSTLMILICLTAEIWSNSKPIFMILEGSVVTGWSKRAGQFEFERHKIFQIRNGEMIEVIPEYAIWPIFSWDPQTRNKSVSKYPSAPTNENRWGTDTVGRDVLARCLYGLRVAFLFSMIVWIFESLLGFALGITAGYFGGALDFILQRSIEIFESIPTFLMLMVIVSVRELSFFELAFLYSLFSWPRLAQVVRVETIRIKNLEFVESAKSVGAGRLRIAIRHILPHCLESWLALSPFLWIGTIFSLAAFDYFGIGLPAPQASLGELINQGRGYLASAWWITVYPTLVLCCGVLMAYATLTSLSKYKR